MFFLKKIFAKNKKFIKYASYGLFGTLIDVSVLYLLTEIIGIFYIFSAIVSDIFRGFTNYNLHKKYVFKDKTKPFSLRNLKYFSKYYFVNITSVFLVFILMIFLKEIIGINFILSKMFADLLMFFYKFFFHSKFIFRKKINQDVFNKIIKDAYSLEKKYRLKYTDNPKLTKYHIEKARYFVVYLSKKEGIDSKPLEIAAILHDIGKIKSSKNHSFHSHNIVEDFLKNYDIDKENKKIILEAVKYHSYKHIFNKNKKETKILQCADALSTLSHTSYFVYLKEKSTNRKTKKRINKYFKKASQLKESKKIAEEFIQKINKII